ncbi:MAG: translocation/assembly module TamB domain-containing protein [Fimbriimonadia bacterium]|jgi:translocation and assembly module TamB
MSRWLSVIPILIAGAPIVCALWFAYVVIQRVVAGTEAALLPAAVRTVEREYGVVVRYAAADYDLRKGTLIATDVAVSARDGHPLALAPALRVKFPGIDVPRSYVRVEADSALLHVVRLEDGSFELQRLLARPERKPSEMPLDIALRDATLLYTDRGDREPRQFEVRNVTVNLQALSDAGRLSARGQTDSTADLWINAEWAAGRGRLSAAADSLRGAETLAALRTQVGAEAVEDILLSDAQGPVKLALTWGKGETDWITAGDVAARRVSYRGHTASAVRASFIAMPGGWCARGILRAAGGSVAVAAHVQTDRSGSLVDAWVSGSGSSAERLWMLAGRQGPSPVRGSFAGAVNIRGNPASPSVVGSWRVASAQAQGRRVTGLTGEVVYTADRTLALRNLSGWWRGSEVLGEAVVDLRTNEVKAAAHVAGLALESFAETAQQGLSGLADVSAVITGGGETLRVAANVTASALHLTRDLGEGTDWSENLGVGEARLTWRAGQLRMPLGRIAGPLGLLQSTGYYTGDTRELSFDYDVVGLPLEVLRPAMAVRGAAYASGSLTGLPDAPRVSGRAEVYGPELAGFDAALVGGQFDYSREVLTLDDVQLRRGAALVDIAGEVDFRHPDLGPLLALQVSGDQIESAQVLEVLNTDLPLRGLASVNARVSGPLSDVEVAGSARVAEGMIDRLPLDEARAAFVYRNGDILIPQGEARIGGGLLNGSARVGADTIEAHFDLAGVDLAAVNGYLDATTPLSGTADLTASFQGSLSQPDVTISGTLGRPAIVDLQFTSGVLEARSEEGEWNGTLRLVAENRAATVDLHTYRLSDRFVDATGLVTLSLDDARIFARRLVPETDSDTWRRLSKLHGQARLQFGVQGDGEQPSFPFDIRIEDLIVGTREAGWLEAKGTATGKLYNFEAINWNSSVGALHGSGSFALGGDVRGFVDVSNLDAGLLAELDPAYAAVRGRVDVAAQVSGESSRPDVDLTVALTDFGTEKASLDAAMFSLIEVRDGSIRTDGAVLQKEGYVARLSGQVPFRFDPLGIPSDGELQANLTIPEQDLAGLRVFLPALDVERTKGKLFGEPVEGSDERPIRIALSGTLDNPRVEGAAYLSGGEIALQGFEESLHNVTAEVRLEGDEVRLENLKGTSASGGAISAWAVASLDAEADGELRGELKMDALQIRSAVGPTAERLRMTLDGSLALDGRLRRPSVNGSIGISDASLPIPAGWDESATAPRLPFDADLDIGVAFAPSTVLTTSRMDARVQGVARLERTLSLPKATASLTALDGRIRLPASRLRIEPGSRFTIAYDAQREGPAIAVANVDMRARTQIIAAGPVGIPNEYTIDLHITGSLLEDGGLRMNATSSPPDLTEQRILALLGHQGFLDTFAGGDIESTLRNELMDIFGATVLPAFFDVVGPGIAESVGLEALALTYSRFEPLTLNVSKSLFDGLSASYRRSLQGIEQRYQVKLMWRLPIREQFRGTFNLGWSYDEQRVHRLSLEWGTRF